MSRIAYSGNHHSRDGKTPRPKQWNDQLKIEVFESRVKDWTLAIADLLDRKKDHGVNYAKLSIVVSYFEMIGLYLKGATADVIETVRRVDPTRDMSDYLCVKCGTSQETFEKGVREVATAAGWNTDNIDDLSTNLYSALRCGLYHGGMARHGIWVRPLTSGSPFQIEKPDVTVDPDRLIEGIKEHFELYIAELKMLCQRGADDDSDDNKLPRFLRRFDIEVVDKMEEKYRRVYPMT